MNTRKVIRHHGMKGIGLVSSLFLLLFMSQTVYADYFEVWHPRASTTGEDLRGVTYGEGMFVAVGGLGTIITSPNGTAWTSQTSTATHNLQGVTHGKGIFVAVGLQGTIFTSPDGTTWTEQTSGSTMDLFSVTYGEGIFVAVGESGTILTSPDGTTWIERTSGTTNQLVHATYGNGIFVAVGFGSTILTSPNGITWTERTSGAMSIFRGVAYGEGIFVAAGSHGTIITSPNGIKWTERTSGVALGDMFFGVTYARGIFTATANHGMIATSPDGITWTPQTLGADTVVYEGISYGNSTLVIVGDAGIALQSDAAPPCVYTSSFPAVSYNYRGGKKSVRVTATGESCDAPDLIPNEDWLNPEVTQWKNNKGTVRVAANEHWISHTPRSASLSIEGSALTVNQTGPNCAIKDMGTLLYNAPAGGGPSTFSFRVYPMLGCAYTVTTIDTFVHVGSIDLGVLGLKTVNFTVDPNSTAKVRLGKITVLVNDKIKKQFSVKQAKP